ncbi:MAG: endopeptidase La [Oscillospiraceae bacterium]|nr:endopeptidase La [Oscillospiraceae bacterium]
MAGWKVRMNEITNIDGGGIENSNEVVPVLPLRGIVMFPNMILHFDIGRKKSIAAVEHAMKFGKKIFVVTQKHIRKNSPKESDLYLIGTIASVKQILHQSGNLVRVLIEGVCRGQVIDYMFNDNYIEASITPAHELDYKVTPQTKALVRQAQEIFSKYLSLSPRTPPDLMWGIRTIKKMGDLADYIISNAILDFAEKQEVLEELNPQSRLEKLLIILTDELEVLSLENEIAYKLKENLDRHQKEFFLREQIKVISQELGEEDDPFSESEEYRKKFSKLKLDKQVIKKLKKECDRFSKMPPGSSEANTCRLYLDECLSLPWDKASKDNININEAVKILDRDHYGLKDVKERIIEILAVKQLSKNLKSQIICLVGPPGVGKTSIVQSLASAIGRKYVRISLGGVKDESEIRGHRRTYVGAMPGKIIFAMKQAETKNPLILLDEIDKLTRDYNGDPAAALLEVLDPEQNNKFCDHYIDLPFDLSEVLFVTTANDKRQIPPPLYDRMEIINLYSYTYEEKFSIAKKHLISKQLEKNGLNSSIFGIDDESIRLIIDGYTKEAGVRELERKIASLMRKSAKLIVSKEASAVAVNKKFVIDMLGPIKFKKEKISKKSEIGIVRGLAWTSVGGETMPIEVSLMKGKGQVQITGSLGDVMKESAQIAVSYIRSNYDKLGINQDFYNKTDIHIHAPEGAVPKDGPSAGVTMTTAIVSALSNVPVKQDVAMTGEVTLKGKVLPIGGLKEKTMAAYKAGVKTVIIPSENESDLKDIDEVVKTSLHFVMADNLDTVFIHALEKTKNKDKTIVH